MAAFWGEESSLVAFGGSLIRWMVGLALMAALVGPVACLSNDGPDPFTTGGYCLAGDVEGCPCPGDLVGARVCGENQVFENQCRCEQGCTAFPDCSRCGTSCFETCVCTRKGHEAECRAQCPDAS